MIVQPDFPEHWKTRLLVDLTGDPSAPLAIIRLWAHCQHSRRHQFPGMKPGELAAVCKWGDRKPACHTALIKAGFLEKLPGGGYAAHEWDQHNAQLLQKWHAGQRGGRPAANANTNGLGQTEKPTDNRPTTGTKPDRPDQTRPEEIDKKDQTNQTEQAPPSPSASSDGGNGLSNGKMSFSEIRKAVDSDAAAGLAKEVAACLTPFTEPTIQEIRVCLNSHFGGAERYAEAWQKAMRNSGWKGTDGQLIRDWRANAKAYASSAERKNRGIL